MTIKKFNSLYSHYKKNFDIETRLRASNTTYKQLDVMAEKNSGDGEWF